MNYSPGHVTTASQCGGTARRWARPGLRGTRSPAATPLTERQLECLRWAGEGKSSVDIGCILDISPATVNEHLRDACLRLDVRTRVQAIVEAYRQGWLE